MGNFIGSGGYGSVYSGRFGTHTVAIKCVAKHFENAVQRETRALSRCQENVHENIVRYFDYRYQNDHVQIIIDLGDMELFAVVSASENGISEEETRRYARKMVSALAHLHNLDIAHRDIKLENWILHPRYLLVLVDFGLSHTFARGQRHLLKDRVGSMSYCPPEIMRGQLYNPFMGDMWSLGVCFFAMLSGFFPYERADHKDWRFRAVSEHEELVSAIYNLYKKKWVPSWDAAGLIGKLLKPRPQERPQAAKVKVSSWLLHDRLSSRTIIDGEVILDDVIWRDVSVAHPPLLRNNAVIPDDLTCFASSNA